MKWLLILFVLLLAGCQESLIRYSDTDPNIPIEYRGKAAETMAVSIADNAKTATARMAETQQYNKWLYVGFIVAFVGGLIFWGLTRSRYGFVIPSACAVGLGLIFAMAKYADWIALGVLIVGMALLILKVVEYQKERNIETKKLGEQK